MISLSQTLTFGLTALVIIVIPGPSVLFVVGRALAYGRRTALASVAGNEVGSLVLVGAVALGVGTVVGLIFALIALVCDSAWGLVAGGARAWFGRSPRRLALVGGAGGVAMIGLGIGVAVTGRKD